MPLTPSELPPLERTILQAAALHYGRVGRTKLMETTRHAGARLPNGKALSHQGFKPVLERLLEEGRLEGTPATGCAAPASCWSPAPTTP